MGGPNSSTVSTEIHFSLGASHRHVADTRLGFSLGVKAAWFHMRTDGTSRHRGCVGPATDLQMQVRSCEAWTRLPAWWMRMGSGRVVGGILSSPELTHTWG